MDINPFSLLEVTMDSEVVEEDDDDCIIVEPSSLPVKTEPLIIIDDNDSVPGASELEEILNDALEIGPEILEDTGVHFLQQEDPLAIPSGNHQVHDLVARNVSKLSTVSLTESIYRAETYTDIIEVLQQRLHCTICQIHIGCSASIHPQQIEHPLLKVIACGKCISRYSSLTFQLSEEMKDLRCRWCGVLPGRSEGRSLKLCQNCPFGFCELCLHRNVSPVPAKNSGWVCIGCDSRKIWPARWRLWALQSFINKLHNTPNISAGDLSKCAILCQKVKNTKASKPGPTRPILPKPCTSASIEVVHDNKNQENGKIQNGPPLLAQALAGVRVNADLQQLVQVIQQHQPQPVKLLKKLPNCQARLGKKPFPLNGPVTISSQSSNIFTVPNVHQAIATGWISSKLQLCEKDLLNLVERLREIREGTRAKETAGKVAKTVESISTLFALNSTLLKDCGVNIVNEWKEVKARLQLDHMNMNGATTSTGNASRKTPAKRPPPSQVVKKNIAKKSKNNYISVDDDVKKEFNIKPCSVRLTRIPMSIANSAMNGTCSLSNSILAK